MNTSSHELWARTAVWMTAALSSGRKVFYTPHDRDPLLDRAERVASVLRKVSGRRLVEIVAEPGSASTPVRPDDSYDWHLELLMLARRQGFASAAFTGDRQLRHKAAASPGWLVAQERVLERVVARPGVRMLCRYNPQLLSRGVSTQVLRTHFRSVDDEHWGADLLDGRLVVAGEIDLANVDRFAQVLDAAVLDGVLTLDLEQIEFLGADGIGVVVRKASQLAGDGRSLVLVNLPPLVRRTLSVLGLHQHPGLRIDDALNPVGESIRS